MRIHFIAIGGAAMHNLAIALHKKGEHVTGSDDEIFDPSKSRLKKYGLLPQKIGWDEGNISSDLDAIILGMHARKDNPELLKAKELGLKIYSYPEYLYEHSKNKKRIVIGGSHGKTSITALVLHALSKAGIETDYMVGAQLEGFEVMVRLSDSADYMVFEGDEYLTSPIDLRPKFHLYKPHIALLSGIAWDHINVFPTFENYVDQFRIFIDLIEEGGCLVYCKDDQELERLAQEPQVSVDKQAYQLPDFKIVNGQTIILNEGNEYPLKVFGNHNLYNLNGARLVCNPLGISDHDFYEAISSFKGASNRLEMIAESNETKIYKDFAHSPSKLKATVSAVKEQFKEKELVACMELHTFSSLNANFISEYKDSMNKADLAIVYFNPHVFKHKRLPEMELKEIEAAFNHPNLRVYSDSEQLKSDLKAIDWSNKNLLLMSSGNFDGMDYKQLAEEIL